MNAEILTEYMEKIYGYAIRHTYSREEADELAQEILFAAVQGLENLREEGRFEGWLWGLAANVTRTFRRNMGKRRAIYSFDYPEMAELSYNMAELAYEDEYRVEEEEIYSALREKIAMLSALYREIVILYYYDGLTTGAIAERLEIPEGTVSWRLAEARRKLKKECETMNESALRPIQMKLDIYGSGNFNGNVPFPHEFINDALSQNILWYCYEQPRTVEDISRYCGVPAYYVEDSIAKLLNKAAMIQPVKGKYQTDFLIWLDEYGIYGEQNAPAAIAPLTDRMLAGFGELAEKAKDIDFYRAEKDENELFFLYGVMAMDLLARKFNPLDYPAIPTQKDGFCWRYIGNRETGKHPRLQIGCCHCSNEGSRGHYSHTVYGNFGGFGWRTMMYDNYINACEDILRTGSTDDHDAAALAIEAGYIRRLADGRLFVTVPAFTMEQKHRFDETVLQIFSPMMEEYSAMVEEYAKGYWKIFPAHLADDGKRMCNGLFSGFWCILSSRAITRGMVELVKPGSICDVMVQIKS